MGNKHSTAKVENLKVNTALGSCGFGSCASSCCEEEATEGNKKLAEQAKEIQLALRYGKNMNESELLKAIKKIVEETGVVPDVVVLKPGEPTPEVTKRTLSVRIDDHSP